MKSGSRVVLAFCSALLMMVTVGAIPAPSVLGEARPAAAADPIYDPNGPEGTVYRLYRAYFLREPDRGGFDYWQSAYRQGYALDKISNDFARSEEFEARYGSLDARQFLDRVYANVLGRTPDQAGYDYWLGQMQQGMLRGFVMIYFSDSEEFRTRTGDGVPPGYRTETVRLSGSGPHSFEMNIDGPVIVRSTHDGSSNFIISALDGNGQYAGNAANEIGIYSGEQVLDAYGAVRFIEIDADGRWTVEFAPMRTALGMDIGNAQGRGDAVRYVQVPSARQIRFAHDGSRNFIVTARDGNGRYLRGLVNEIGAYDGTVIVPTGTVILEIVADGSWTTRSG